MCPVQTVTYVSGRSAPNSYAPYKHSFSLAFARYNVETRALRDHESKHGGTHVIVLSRQNTRIAGSFLKCLEKIAPVVRKDWEYLLG
jgi:hypothetical protein